MQTLQKYFLKKNNSLNQNSIVDSQSISLTKNSIIPSSTSFESIYQNNIQNGGNQINNDVLKRKTHINVSNYINNDIFQFEKAEVKSESVSESVSDTSVFLNNTAKHLNQLTGGNEELNTNISTEEFLNYVETKLNNNLSGGDINNILQDSFMKGINKGGYLDNDTITQQDILNRLRIYVSGNHEGGYESDTGKNRTDSDTEYTEYTGNTRNMEDEPIVDSSSYDDGEGEGEGEGQREGEGEGEEQRGGRRKNNSSSSSSSSSSSDNSSSNDDDSSSTDKDENSFKLKIKSKRPKTSFVSDSGNNVIDDNSSSSSDDEDDELSDDESQDYVDKSSKSKQKSKRSVNKSDNITDLLSDKSSGIGDDEDNDDDDDSSEDDKDDSPDDDDSSDDDDKSSDENKTKNKKDKKDKTKMNYSVNSLSSIIISSSKNSITPYMMSSDHSLQTDDINLISFSPKNIKNKKNKNNYII